MITRISAAFIIFFIALLLCTCSGDPKFDQYYAEGEGLYTRHCSNCHQQSGKGLGLVYPPLAQSDYMDSQFDDVLCLMKYGKSGEIVVNGESFNKPMPGVPSLTELEIAEISTYIYNSWGRKKGLIDVKQASESLKACGSR